MRALRRARRLAERSISSTGSRSAMLFPRLHFTACSYERHARTMPRKPSKVPTKRASNGRDQTKSVPKSTARKKKKAVEAFSLGLSAAECESPFLARELEPLAKRVTDVGGRVLCSYREPLSGGYVLFAALPIDKVAPTPFQRELSKTHAQRLSEVIPKVGRFLDPVVAVA